jgi:hypothetical protein
MSNKTKNSKQIQNKTKKNVSANMLKNVCSESNQCIMFGKQIDNIFSFFEKFENPSLIKKITPIGKESTNGFIREVLYEKQGYKTHVIIKSSKKESADNLGYEYIVGLFINKANKLFPCFTTTYFLIHHTQSSWKDMRDEKITNEDLNQIVPINNLDHLTKNNLDNLAITCVNSRLLSIVVQDIKNATTISDKLTDTHFVNNELLYVLYQIYLPLSAMVNVFTHYDLHDKNILIYKPYKTQYITYIYHLKNNKTISFKSQYIAKIIDYGRSYFKDSKISSADIYNKICSISECKPECGNNYGYGPFSSYFGEMFITPNKRNMSHDLRLMHIISDELGDNGVSINDSPTTRHLLTILNQVVYEQGIVEEENRSYGTEENTETNPGTEYIRNVIDAERELRNSILSIQNEEKSPAYMEKYTECGKMHIYTNGTHMKYIPTGQNQNRPERRSKSARTK